MNNIYSFLVEYINNNKNKNNIDYAETIKELKELIKEIEHDFIIEELK